MSFAEGIPTLVMNGSPARYFGDIGFSRGERGVDGSFDVPLRPGLLPPCSRSFFLLVFLPFLLPFLIFP
jgi:hypothetical protein